jgi:hypothetical protein
VNAPVCRPIIRSDHTRSDQIPARPPPARFERRIKLLTGSFEDAQAIVTIDLEDFPAEHLNPAASRPNTSTSSCSTSST